MLATTILGAVLVGARVSLLVLFAPLLGGSAVPARIKAGLTVLITAVLVPVMKTPDAAHLTATGWAVALGGEMVVGLLLALSVGLVFEMAQLAGQVVGFQVGFSLVNVIDPQTQVDTPVISIFHQTLATLIFLQLDVHHWLIRGLARSFDYLPPGAVLLGPSVARMASHAAGAVWLGGLQIAAPALVATMLADVAIGFLGKASPQMPLLAFSMPVKALVGVGAIAGALVYWPGIFAKYFTAAMAVWERMLGMGR